MAVIPDIRVDWRGDGLSTLTNDSFVTDTSGWSVAAGINAAATSITRATGDGVLGGVATNTCAELVTTGTNGSGCKFVLSGTFSTGRTYRFSVWLKSVSGTTSAKILIGSLGTGADRASSTPTITASWVRYSVDWTPTGNRSDVQVNVTNNAASIMTARICLAEVFEAIDDIGAYGANEVDRLTYGRGANFDGSVESPGTATIHVQNITQKYAPDNASGALFGLLTTGRPVMIRAVSGQLVYGIFAGQIRRILNHPAWGEKTAELVCEDRMYDLSIAEVSIAASVTRSIQSFRTAILTAVGWASNQSNLSTGSPELHQPLTEADEAKALDVLAELNLATGTVHFIEPHPSPSVGWVYTTFDRTLAQTAASIDTIDDNTSPGIVGMDNYDVTDEAVITSQRVFVTTRVVDTTSRAWTLGDLPFTLPAGTSRTFWASFSDPVFVQTADYAATGSPTVVLTAFSRSGKIVVTAGGADAIFTDLGINGQVAAVYARTSVVSTTGTAMKKGNDIDTGFVEKDATGQGLADYTIQRYGSEKPRPDLSVENWQPNMVTRDITDTIAVNFALLSLSAKRFQIRSFSTTVDSGALDWTTTYGLEVAMADTLLFTVGGSASEGIGGTGILAY